MNYFNFDTEIQLAANNLLNFKLHFIQQQKCSFELQNNY